MDGGWFGLWIMDLATGTETWTGALKFPNRSGRARIHGSTVEIYGSPIRPIDVPQWHVSVGRWATAVHIPLGILDTHRSRVTSWMRRFTTTGAMT